MKGIFVYIFLLCLVCLSSQEMDAQVTFAGSSEKVINIKPEASTGLNSIFVVYDTDGVTANYKSKGGKVTWMRYADLGGGHAQEIAFKADGANSSVDLGAQDCGYIIEDGTDRYYFWVVNYANHHARFDDLSFAEDQECDRARLSFSGSAGRIPYFSITGVPKELSRNLVVDYYTLKYNEETMSYDQMEASQTFDYIEGTIGVFAPLCDTRFTLSGDRFLKEWGHQIEISTSSYSAIAVDAQTIAEQSQRDADNEQKVDDSTLGGSAPVEVHFAAAVSDAAIFREWQMLSDSEFEVITDRFQLLDFDYTFRHNGNTYVRFVANNAAGTCEYVGETYDVYIGDSDLLCPNAFSPNGDGVNDEWKVSYKSIVDFECHIFNRWGQEMISFTNPAQGWDGRYKGKIVPTGAYFYVIKAKGSDGRKYNLSGDINIIHSEKGTSSVSPEE